MLLLLLLSVWSPTHGVIHNVAILWDTLFHFISFTLYVPAALGTSPVDTTSSDLGYIISRPLRRLELNDVFLFFSVCLSDQVKPCEPADVC